MAIINHVQQAISRLIAQYTEAESVKDYLRAVLSEAEQLEQVFCELMLNRSLDTAQGVSLDIIGDIVGQPRIIIDGTFLSFFGFDGAPGAQAFGILSNPALGGRFRGVDESTTGNVELADPEYRIYIRARIKKNFTRATIEDIIDMTIFVFGATKVIITEGDRAYRVDIGRVLTPNEQALLLQTDLLPKPIGIRVEYGFFDPDSVLAWGRLNNPPLPDTDGLGTLADPNVGGKFSSIISL